MQVAIATDHAGFCQKAAAIKALEEMGHTVLDYGPKTDERVDYPDFAHKVAHVVAKGEADAGVLICGTGLGMALAATKLPGIRAVPIQTPGFAELARAHNNANVLCLSARYVSEELNAEIMQVFLETPFAGERHVTRVKKIEQI